MTSQKSPTRNPDLANMYGSPRIPAPIIVPLRVNVVAQNFLFIVTCFAEGILVFNCLEGNELGENRIPISIFVIHSKILYIFELEKFEQITHRNQGLVLERARRESNSHLQGRNLIFYPLNYELC